MTVLAAIIVQKTSDLQLFVEGGGAALVASAVFYLGRVLGRLDASIRGLDRRVELLEDAGATQPVSRPGRAR